MQREIPFSSLVSVCFCSLLCSAQSSVVRSALPLISKPKVFSFKCNFEGEQDHYFQSRRSHSLTFTTSQVSFLYLLNPAGNAALSTYFHWPFRPAVLLLPPQLWCRSCGAAGIAWICAGALVTLDASVFRTMAMGRRRKW